MKRPREKVDDWDCDRVGRGGGGAGNGGEGRRRKRGGRSRSEAREPFVGVRSIRDEGLVEEGEEEEAI